MPQHLLSIFSLRKFAKLIIYVFIGTFMLPLYAMTLPHSLVRDGEEVEAIA